MVTKLLQNLSILKSNQLISHWPIKKTKKCTNLKTYRVIFLQSYFIVTVMRPFSSTFLSQHTIFRYISHKFVFKLLKVLQQFKYNRVSVTKGKMKSETIFQINVSKCLTLFQVTELDLKRLVFKLIKFFIKTDFNYVNSDFQERNSLENK